MTSNGYTKSDSYAPQGFFEAEASGLRWLAEVEHDGGVCTAHVLNVDDSSITMERVPRGRPTSDDADEFGRALARTHAAGAPGWGWSPSPFGFIGPLPMPVCGDDDVHAYSTFGAFYAHMRMEPFLRDAVDSGSVSHSAMPFFERVIARLDDGEFDVPQPRLVKSVARLHGDLWSGNVMWTGARSERWTTGAALIDPAAHGGHGETDLAMLSLFGLDYLDRVISAYTEVSALADGWRDRVALHQLHPLLVHAVLFGGGYGSQATSIAKRYA